VNKGQIGLQDAEQEILQFVNWVGDLMAQEVVEGVAEPTRANRIIVDGEVAVFEQARNLPRSPSSDPRTNWRRCWDMQ